MAILTKRRLIKYLVLLAVLIASFYIVRMSQPSKHQGHPRDYADIAKEGILRVATEYNSISFYVDGDTIAGFHYQLIQAFAHDKGLKTLITPLMSFEERLKGLSEGKYDVIAYGILATNPLKDSLLLTTPIVLTKQVLVQRKEKGPNDSLYVRSQLDLARRTLHVVKGSPSILRIKNLSNEIGDTIFVKEIEKYGTEQLIALVAHGDIDYAVCDESTARVVAASLSEIDIRTDISFTQFHSWAVSKQSPALLDSLNTWLREFQKKEAYKKIYNKYYSNR